MIFTYKFEIPYIENKMIISPLEHMLKLRCREDAVDRIKSDSNINEKYELNISRVNRWWWDVCFIDKECKEFEEEYREYSK